MAAERPPGRISIVIAHRNWMWVGFVNRENDEIVIRRAMNIRRWNTTRGLGEIAPGPKTGKDPTILDLAGTVRIHPWQIVATLDAGDGWIPFLEEQPLNK